MTNADVSPNPLSDTLFAGGGEMGKLIRSLDWSNTPLGAVENWSPSLRTSVSTMLASRLAQVIVWGEDYIQLYNDALMPIYGAKHPKALGRPLPEWWSEIWDDQLKPTFEGVRNTGEAVLVEDQLYPLFRSGYQEETYFTICFSPIWDETGTISAVLSTNTETTKQVISQRRLTMLRELATAGSGAKTLQSACLAAADTLNPYDIPFALFYQVNSQGDNATIEAKLVKDLLDVSSILSGKFQLNSQLVDLVLLVQNAIETFRNAAQAKNIQLVETISNVAQSNILADGDRLTQIITNLLDNAIKFTPEGGRVNVRLEWFDFEVHITVTDTGCGISPDFLPVIFNRFSQAEVPSRHSPGGVGIGLAITRSLVSLHSGTISAQSPGVGQGATFIVTLPLISS